MHAKRLLVGILVGSAVLFVTGYLIFEVAAAGLYAANLGSASNVQRPAQIVWAVIAGAVAYATLITFAIAARPSPGGVRSGALVGAIVGFLVWFAADFTHYGLTNMWNLTLTVVDPLLEFVHGGLGGAAVALIVSRTAAAQRSERTAV